MRKNVKLPEIDKKRNKLSKKDKFLLKRLQILYVLDKYLKVRVHEILGHQTNVHVRFYYFKHIANMILGCNWKNRKHTEADPKKNKSYKKVVR